MDLLRKYLQQIPEKQQDSGAIAYLAALSCLQAQCPAVAAGIMAELLAQRQNLKLIASENYSSLAVQLAMGNLFTDKYSEGSIGHRFYAGCENVDAIEQLAATLAKEIFQCEHAYVQPPSGADANLIAYWAILVQQVQDKEVAKLQKKSALELTSVEYEKIR